MSPLEPPVGGPEETVLIPKPLESDAMLITRLADKSPPPVRPAPPVIVIVSAAAPIPDLAPAGLPDPVPPADTANGVIPVIEPPVIVTALAF